jgi:hypothetical protein
MAAAMTCRMRACPIGRRAERGFGPLARVRGALDVLAVMAPFGPVPAMAEGRRPSSRASFFANGRDGDARGRRRRGARRRRPVGAAPPTDRSPRQGRSFCRGRLDLDHSLAIDLGDRRAVDRVARLLAPGDERPAVMSAPSEGITNSAMAPPATLTAATIRRFAAAPRPPGARRRASAPRRCTPGPPARRARRTPALHDPRADLGGEAARCASPRRRSRPGAWWRPRRGWRRRRADAACAGRAPRPRCRPASFSAASSVLPGASRRR